MRRVQIESDAVNMLADTHTPLLQISESPHGVSVPLNAGITGNSGTLRSCLKALPPPPPYVVAHAVRTDRGYTVGGFMLFSGPVFAVPRDHSPHVTPLFFCGLNLWCGFFFW